MIWLTRGGSTSSYAAGAALAVLLGGFGLIADEVSDGETMKIDQAVLMALRTPGDPTDPIGPAWLEEAARDVTALGSFTVLAILITVVVLHLFLIGRRRTGWFLTASVIGGTILSSGLKSLFDRPRPDLTGVARVFTTSFPSGHATVSAVVYLTLGALLAEMTESRGQKILYLGSAVLLTVMVGSVASISACTIRPTCSPAGRSGPDGRWPARCLRISIGSAPQRRRSRRRSRRPRPRAGAARLSHFTGLIDAMMATKSLRCFSCSPFDPQ